MPESVSLLREYASSSLTDGPQRAVGTIALSSECFGFFARDVSRCRRSAARRLVRCTAVWLNSRLECVSTSLTRGAELESCEGRLQVALATVRERKRLLTRVDCGLFLSQHTKCKRHSIPMVDPEIWKGEGRKQWWRKYSMRVVGRSKPRVSGVFHPPVGSRGRLPQKLKLFQICATFNQIRIVRI